MYTMEHIIGAVSELGPMGNYNNFVFEYCSLDLC